MQIQITDTPDQFGLVSILLHWTIAISYISLFGIGWYMVTLGYYDPWYTTLPYWHKSVGMLLIAIVLLKVIWRLFVRKPAALASHRAWEVTAGTLAHWGLGLGIVVVLLSGYLIPTAEGAGVALFNWLTIPAMLSLPEQEDIAGVIHRYVAYIVLGISFVHVAAALKHHFFDGDKTLLRMLSVVNNRRKS